MINCLIICFSSAYEEVIELFESIAGWTQLT